MRPGSVRRGCSSTRCGSPCGTPLPAAARNDAAWTSTGGFANRPSLPRHSSRHIAASAMVCAAPPHALAFELQTRPIVVADGAWLLPDFVNCLELADVDIASVFLHESDRMQLERAMSCRRDVVMVAPWHAESVRLAWLYGNWLASEAGPPRCRSLPRGPMKLLQIAPWPSLACCRRDEPGALRRCGACRERRSVSVGG